LPGFESKVRTIKKSFIAAVKYAGVWMLQDCEILKLWNNLGEKMRWNRKKFPVWVSIVWIIS
jgi:hypothetical protein